MKEKKSYVWAAMSCSLVIHLAVVPWVFEVVDVFLPKGWWSAPLHCSMAAIFIFTLICLAAFIDCKIEDK